MLAAESAFFGLAFVNIGLMPDGGSTLFVPARRQGRAFQMALLGERVPAAQALDWGLVNYVYPDDRLLDEANALVETRCAGPDPLLRGPKRALNRMLCPDLEGQLDLEAESPARARPHAGLPGGRDGLRREARAGVPGRVSGALGTK